MCNLAPLSNKISGGSAKPHGQDLTVKEIGDDTPGANAELIFTDHALPPKLAQCREEFRQEEMGRNCEKKRERAWKRIPE